MRVKKGFMPSELSCNILKLSGMKNSHGNPFQKAKKASKINMIRQFVLIESTVACWNRF
ncbi:MAG: hypothetical protein JWO44_1883 [Bacteroidetes bacterium]|jgi:hypothetical protein|nr:hypothetical protein [Bacteroidota bacterium]